MRDSRHPLPPPWAGAPQAPRGAAATTVPLPAVAGLTFSRLGQTSATARFGLFAGNDRWKIDGDNRFQWTSQNTFGLGGGTTEADKQNVKFDYSRVYDAAYRALGKGLFAGIGFHYRAHTGVEPGSDADGAWSDSSLCLDLAWGQYGSHGLYLTVKEAFSE